jgi:hypothetical protein
MILPQAFGSTSWASDWDVVGASTIILYMQSSSLATVDAIVQCGTFVQRGRFEMGTDSFKFDGAVAYEPSASFLYASGTVNQSGAFLRAPIDTHDDSSFSGYFEHPTVIEDAQNVRVLSAGHTWIVAIVQPWRLVIYQYYDFETEDAELLPRLRLWLPALLHLAPQTVNAVAISETYCSVLYGQTFVLRFDDEPLVTVACAQGVLETFFLNVTDSQRLSQVVIDQDVASDSLAVVVDQDQPTILWVSFHVCGAAHAEVAQLR